MGTPELIILNGGTYADFSSSYTFTIPVTENPQSNIIRFEFGQSAADHDFIMNQMVIQVEIQTDAYDWVLITTEELEQATCTRIHGNNAQVRVSTDKSGELDFFGFEENAENSGTLRCDITSNHYR
eukprot:UN09820